MARDTRPRGNSLARDLSSDWVRLRTLLLLRWMAIFGQTVAVVLASFRMGLQVELGLCFLAIGASVLSNMIAMAIFPPNQRLNDWDAMLTLLFDLIQLSFLLFLTGGLNNPFALLIVAPVTISATALTLRSTVILGIAATLLITGLAFFHLPLQTADGREIIIPDLIRTGFWVSIVIGILFLSGYARRVSREIHTMSRALMAAHEALAREQKLTDLGGVVAAAAHELGTPLATIKLVSTELAEELADNKVLAEDAMLIREQADRCRDILRDMGQMGKDDLHMHSALFSAVIREAAEPHIFRGIDVNFQFAPRDDSQNAEPVIDRRPEIIHGVRNLVQNAVDFASKRIWIEGDWTDPKWVDGKWTDIEIRLCVTDDGDGYPQDLIGHLGDPFLRRRKVERADNDLQRPGYEGMGLGLFISKTLLERSGASLKFSNASNPFLLLEEESEKRGAQVEVTWKGADIQVKVDQARGPLGENQRIQI